MSKFLIVRLGALGDVIHAIPVAAALRNLDPSLEEASRISGAGWLRTLRRDIARLETRVSQLRAATPAPAKKAA